MLQNPRKTLGYTKNMVYKIPPGGGGKPYPASGLQEEVDDIDGIKTLYRHVKTEISASKSIFHLFHTVLWSMDHTQKMTFQCI